MKHSPLVSVALFLLDVFSICFFSGIILFVLISLITELRG